MEFVRILLALAAGGTVGLGFGMLQALGARRNQVLAQTGRLSSAWKLMPSSAQRVALLMIALAAIQLVCPMLFKDNTQWWVSGGVVAGYGWHLFSQFRRRRLAGIA
ncbi:MAG TPA: hypothetical protein VMF06_00135 [Candidatus Limnocylindria bacterium]|jgi:hypothetical protein|nr:hypothetical protein [Candidatus Limnocylindria bacterium]